MKKNIMVIVLALLSVGITACSAIGNDKIPAEGKGTASNQTNTSKGSYSKIKPEDAKKRLDSEKGIILLDVRTQQEYVEKHIPNSLLIPVDVIEKEAPLKIKDKNAIIFVYCRSGNRSAAASAALAKMGYTGVFDLGGIIDWPYETVSGK